MISISFITVRAWRRMPARTVTGPDAEEQVVRTARKATQPPSRRGSRPRALLLVMAAAVAATAVAAVCVPAEAMLSLQSAQAVLLATTVAAVAGWLHSGWRNGLPRRRLSSDAHGQYVRFGAQGREGRSQPQAGLGLREFLATVQPLVAGR